MSRTANTNNTVRAPRIEGRIQEIRGLRVIIDADLATLYGVPTKVLNQAVKRNSARFPQDFMFQLDGPEKAEVVTNCDHRNQLKFSKALPFAFIKYGAVALANVLASPQAVEMGIYPRKSSWMRPSALRMACPARRGETVGCYPPGGATQLGAASAVQSGA